MNTKYLAAYIRRNVDGKKDYLSVYEYSEGYGVVFDTYDAALEKAKAICADESRAAYAPAAIPVKI
jgi:hypothetical protein